MGMTTTLLALALALPLAQERYSPPLSERKPHPLAPSLPQLTRDEEDDLDRIIDRFMKADIGLLRGDEAAKAKRDFDKLGPESIPALIRGLNRAALIEHSCPVVVIGTKLHRMLQTSNDLELLEFARDNIGSGVGRTTHSGFVQDLRFRTTLHKNTLASQMTTLRGPKLPKYMSLAELTGEASTAQGPRLKQVLLELEGRRGPEVLGGLSVAATNSDADIQKLSRDLMDKHLSRQSANTVKERLKDENVEIRKAALRVAGAKHPSLTGNVIDLLTDAQADVRETAHQSLARQSREDFGPNPDATTQEREQAQQRWREWWGKKR
jgi:hypothetical protein